MTDVYSLKAGDLVKIIGEATWRVTKVYRSEEEGPQAPCLGYKLELFAKDPDCSELPPWCWASPVALDSLGAMVLD